jgi:hypothetical protein
VAAAHRWVLRAPTISVGSPTEYARGESRAREYLREYQIDPDQLLRVDARIDYRGNRITLFRLQDPRDPLSVGDTISHEVLHALLDQAGEWLAARTLDLVCKPVGDPDRRGGF